MSKPECQIKLECQRPDEGSQATTEPRSSPALRLGHLDLICHLSFVIGLLLAALPASAAERTVRSLDLTLSRRDDIPVVRRLMTTRPGGRYNPRALAADLRRLGMLGYELSRFEIRFTPGAAAVALVASDADKPAAPDVAALELVGGDPTINELCRSGLSQRPSTLFQTRPLDPRSLLVWDVWGIEAQYRAHGYLAARVTELAIAVGDGRAARVRIRIQPGKPFTLGKVTVQGNRKIDAARLIGALKLGRSPRWTGALRHQVVRRASDFCRENGYLDARVRAVVEPRPAATADVRLELTEGEQTVIHQVVVRGAGDLEDRVAKLVAFRQGQVVRQSAVDALRRAVEDLGIFARVELRFVEVKDKPAGNRDLLLQVDRADLGRRPGAAETLYYRMAQNLIRLYNRGPDGLRSLRVRGSATFAKATVEIDATVVRPGYARVRLRFPPRVGGRPPQELLLLQKGDRLFVRCSSLGKTWRMRSGSVGLRIAVLPPDLLRGLPAKVDVSLGVAQVGGRLDVILLGERCPPAAAYLMETAKVFARRPPKLEAPGVLLLPDGATGEGTVRVHLDKGQLPRQVVRRDKDGRVTAQFDLEINAAAAAAEAAKPIQLASDQNASTGLALFVPVMLALNLPGAGRLADEAVAANPKGPAALAARGLARLASGPPEPGLSDLRAAAASKHPAYALLLAETLIRGKRFNEAKAVCRTLLASAGTPKSLAAADLLLAGSLSVPSAVELIASGRRDYRRRAAVDAALAHLGLGEYRAAADRVRPLLRDRADDPQAIELLARCELSLGRPAPALAALGKLPPGRPNPTCQVYAALAHHVLGRDDRAVAALAAAMKTGWIARNLLLLQDQAAEIHPRFKAPAARAALAKLFSRAALGELKAGEKAKAAAIVNDVLVPKAEIDRWAAKLAGPADPKGKEYATAWARARRQVVEDTLILRWAMWSRLGLAAVQRDVAQAIDADRKELGAASMAEYKKLLTQRGTTIEDRREEILRRQVKRRAFSKVLSDRVLVRPPEILAYYETNPDQFTVPVAARFRMITLHFVRFRDKEQATQLAAGLLRRLRAKPDSFEKLAGEYSHDANAGHGGLWDGVRKGSLLAPLDQAVFAMKPGQTSGIIRTDRGCHIVRLETLTPKRKEPLDEAAPRIGRAMQQAGARVQVAAWLRKLKSESYIELLD